jgi:hypothetical protein
VNVITATEAKNRLGAALSLIDDDNLMIEKNGRQLAMVFNAKLGKYLVLNGYSTGVLSRSNAMNLLGFTWYGQLIDAMDDSSIPMPAPSSKYIKSMSDDVVTLLGSGCGKTD